KGQTKNHAQSDDFLSERTRKREERRRQKAEKIENKDTNTDKLRKKSKEARQAVVNKRKSRKRKRRRSEEHTLNSSHAPNSYAVYCLKQKNTIVHKKKIVK